jgi:transposase
MRKIEFSPDGIKQLRGESNLHPHHLVRRRMRALLLKSEGLAHGQIGHILGISQPTLRAYFDLYLQGGVETLKQLNYQGKANLLLDHKDEIISALEAEPPATLKQAQARIEAVTGLQRSLPQVREFLKKTDFGVGK